MRGSAFIAFLGFATAISGSLVGCSDDDDDAEEAKPAKVTKSGEGESCRFTDDCDTDLACYSGVCLPSPSGTGGTDGTGGSSNGGTTSNPVQGGPGESCTRRLDCQPGLGCFNQRCAETDTGEGGGGNVPTQGERGETCLVSSDCAAPLVCLPAPQGTPGATNSIGICSDANTDVAPTGRVCGAECLAPTDCCEIPIELHLEIGVKSCADLADVLDGVTCNAAATGQNAIRCFVDAAYCSGCTEDTWDCTAGVCLYNALCSADGHVFEGCPQFSRIGRPMSPVCDAMDTQRCQAPAVDPVCTDDMDCDTLPVSDDLADTCNAGECTCFEQRCLRRCNGPLDCRVGYTCDTGDDVCLPEGACTSDESCKAQMADIRAVCTDGVCTMPCNNDLDCNPDGLTGGFRQVCNSQNQCEAIGCNDDTNCGSPYNNGTVKTFCTEPQAAAGARGAQSAVTD